MGTNFTHEYYMRRCLELAMKGSGKVAPNPKVGAVIVHKNVIIGEGFHGAYGGPHAEVYAINSVKNKALLKEATIYVSLEPCSHHGKTPPCADLIVAHRIPNVVIGMQDPFAKVNGEGIKRLEAAGSQVAVGVLEEACRALNNEFITYHTRKRPYVILKWAQTLDGLIDKKREAGAVQEPNWITNEECRSLVHKWRSECHSIMIGTNTARIDNPQLNVRSWAGKNPTRIVVDRSLQLPKDLHVFDHSVETLVLNEMEHRQEGNLNFIKLDFGAAFLHQVMQMLYQRGISCLLVEGGQAMLQSFIQQNLWDEARVFTGNTYFYKGVAAPAIKGIIASKESLGDNLLTVYKNNTWF